MLLVPAFLAPVEVVALALRPLPLRRLLLHPLLRQQLHPLQPLLQKKPCLLQRLLAPARIPQPERLFTAQKDTALG